MLSMIGSISSQDGIKRYQDIVVPTHWYHLRPNDGYDRNMRSHIKQAPSESSIGVLFGDIYVKDGFLNITVSQNYTLAALEPDLEGGSANSSTSFGWTLEYTDGTTTLIEFGDQTSYDRYNGESQMVFSAYWKTGVGSIFPFVIGDKIPYRFRMDYSGSGWDSSWGNYSLSQTNYFPFVKR